MNPRVARYPSSTMMIASSSPLRSADGMVLVPAKLDHHWTDQIPPTMKTLMIACALSLFGMTRIHAQTQGALDKAGADSRSCMLMSDSMSTALGLSEEQQKRVRISDEKCVQACEKVGYRTSGNMDEAAMRRHEAEMREILTAIQFDRWSAMCMTTKVHKDHGKPMTE